MTDYHEKLDNYAGLLARVDDHCRRLETQYADHLACREGCDGCCRHISLFPVEAAALALALRELSANKASYIRERAHRSENTDHCPLLENGCCLLYGARPIICRTHGYPLLTEREGEKVIDFCPKNFNGITSFPKAFVMDLDLLNATLAAVNSVFIASCAANAVFQKPRLSIADALILEI